MRHLIVSFFTARRRTLLCLAFWSMDWKVKIPSVELAEKLFGWTVMISGAVHFGHLN